MSNTPQIRFAGFTDAWEQRKLGEIATFINGRAYSQEELLNAGKYKVLRVGNFYTNDSWYYSDMELGDKYYAENGDLLYTWSATFGPHIWRGEKVIYHYHIWKIELSQYLEKRFAVQLLEQDKAAILSDKNGSTMVHITKAGMEEKRVLIPQKTDEQEKIGSFLENLDTLITLHQRKCDTLKALKKAMLQKMFPKEGASVPEIRFAGFTDDWEQREFKNITFPSGVKNKENLPYESYSVTNENGFIPQNEQFENGGTMATADKTMYYIVTPNSFAYNPARINVGSIGYYKGTENVIVSSLYEVFQTTDEIDDRFLWHWFKSEKFQRMIEQYQEGGVRLYFYYDKLCMCSISAPKIEEQRKIGAYFDNLDTLITLHQRKLETLQKMKKSLLQKMFV